MSDQTQGYLNQEISNKKKGSNRNLNDSIQTLPSSGDKMKAGKQIRG